MAKRTRITKKDIDLIKALLTAGLTKSKIEEISKRSYNVIAVIEKSDGTLEDYKKVSRELHEEYISKKTEAQPPRTKITDYVNVPDLAIKELAAMRDEQAKQSQRLEHIETLLNELIETIGAQVALKKSADSNGRRTLGLFK